MKDIKVKKLYHSALHTLDFDERPLRVLIADVYSFSKLEIVDLCEDIYTSLIYLLASCEKTKEIMELAEVRRDLDFMKSGRNAVRFLLVSVDFVSVLEDVDNLNLGFLSGVSKDYFYSLDKSSALENWIYNNVQEGEPPLPDGERWIEKEDVK